MEGMTDQSSTGPEDLDPLLAPDGDAAEGTRSNEEVEEKAVDGESERQGPMVDDASIDWSAIDGGGAPAGIPTDPEPTEGNAPAS